MTERASIAGRQAAEVLLVREALASGLIEAPVRPAEDSDKRTDADLLHAYARAECDRHAELRRLHHYLPWLTGARPGAWLFGPALIAGMLLSGLTATGLFNILAPPLLGLLAWQLLVFALLLWPWPIRPPGQPGPLRRMLLWVGKRWSQSGADERAALIPARFAMAFTGLAPKRVGGMLAATLHGAAAAFALGAIAGLYWDGLGVAYQAYWESTFLGAATVSAIVGVLLAPSSWLTGIGLPDASGVAAMQFDPVPAAPWIHLWATTLAWAVVVPRLLLAGAALYQARRHERVALDFDDPVLQRIVGTLRGVGISILVQPLGYRPDSRALDRLRGRLADDYRGAVSVEVAEPLPWGRDDLPAPPNGTDRLLLLLNPAQTPEEEVHGPLLDAAQRHCPLTVALDGAAYRTSKERRQSRMASWGRMLEARDVGCIALEVEE